jgi:hypothetical protein
MFLAAALAPADESLARAVPADVGLFIELRQADDLLTQLVEPQLWLTLAELAGQPASLKETEQWEKRIEQTLKMSPADAIAALFSQRVAFVAQAARRTQEAVIICRPASDQRQLLRRWQARPLPTLGRTALYSLPGNVSVAIHDDLMIFGDPLTRAMFDRVLGQLDGQPESSLAADPRYQRLLGRAPANPDGVLFVRLDQSESAAAPEERQPARALWSDLPQILRGSSSVLFALHRADRTLQISAIGDSPAAPPTHDDSLAPLVSSLPRQTLVAWAGHVDYPALVPLIANLPERNVFRVAYQLQEGAGTVQRLLAALNSATCVALGTVMPENRLLPAPPVPALAVLVHTRDAGSVATEWANLFHTSLDLYRLLSLKVADPARLPPLQNFTLVDTEIEQLDLSLLVSEQPEQTPVGELHVSWALDGDVLILASHTDWLRQILEARHGLSPAIGPLLETADPPARPHAETFLVGQTAALGDFGAFWLRFCERFAPEVVTEAWWRNYQPGGRTVRLGVQVTVDPERPRLLVRSVTPDTPAEGLLRPGDEIIGCNRRRFATSQPVQEIQDGLASRPVARWIDLLIERDRVVRVKRIPLPFVDPVEITRRLAAVGRVVQRVVYVEDASEAAGTRGYLTLELRTDPRPQFDFPPAPVTLPLRQLTTRTTSRPVTATAPASEPVSSAADKP